MQTFWQRFCASLTICVRTLLCLWTILFLCDAALAALHLASLKGWLALTVPLAYQPWRLISYACLPSSLSDLIASAIALIIFGGMLERVWGQRKFSLYVLLAVVGSGLLEVLLRSWQPAPLLGPAPISFAVLLAAGWVCGGERVEILPGFVFTLRQVVVVLAVISIVSFTASAGWVNALVRVGGGALGLGYIGLRSAIVAGRTTAPVNSRRITRLEL